MNRRSYGYGKALRFFSDLPEFLKVTSVEVPPHGPIHSITLLPRPAEGVKATPTKTVKATPAKKAKAQPTKATPTKATESKTPPPCMTKKTISFPDAIQKKLNTLISGKSAKLSSALHIQVQNDYNRAVEEKQLTHDKTLDTYTFHLTAKSAHGTSLVANVKRNPNAPGPKWVFHSINEVQPAKTTTTKTVKPKPVENVKPAPAKTVVSKPVESVKPKPAAPSHPADPSKPTDPLRKFAILGDINAFLQHLADLAQEEPWGFSKREDDRIILWQYINYTYLRLEQEKKVCIDSNGDCAAFNTGLQTRRLGEDIFAYFVPNSVSEAPWRFGGFFSSDSGNPIKRSRYKEIVKKFQEPEAATYYDKPSDLVFDPSCAIHLSSDHIFKDNCARLPDPLLRKECSSNSNAMSLLDEIDVARKRKELTVKALYKKLGQEIFNDLDLFKDLRLQMQDALERTLKRLRRNYTLAVPFFSFRFGTTIMLLPISFTASEPASVALVCERTPSGEYFGHTIYTLSMAYKTARILCRPRCEWLDPSKITSDEDADLEETE